MSITDDTTWIASALVEAKCDSGDGTYIHAPTNQVVAAVAAALANRSADHIGDANEMVVRASSAGMPDRERAILAIRRGVPLGEAVKCSCFTDPPTRNGCFGVCEDAVAAIIASYEAIRAERDHISPGNQPIPREQWEPWQTHLFETVYGVAVLITGDQPIAHEIAEGAVQTASKSSG